MYDSWKTMQIVNQWAYQAFSSNVSFRAESSTQLVIVTVSPLVDFSSDCPRVLLPVKIHHVLSCIDKCTWLQFTFFKVLVRHSL